MHPARVQSSALQRIALAAYALALFLCLLLPLATRADEPAWQYRAQVYAWLPDISGKTSYPPSTGGVGAQVDFSDYLTALRFAFMGGLEATKGPYGVLADFIYLDFATTKSGTRDLTLTGPGGQIQVPVDASANAHLGLHGWTGTLAATYQVIDETRYQVQLLGGARYLQATSTFDWQFSGNVGSLPVGAASGSGSVSASKFDVVTGAKARARLGEGRWYGTGYLDLVTGQSNFTWQAAAGLGYAFDWGEVVGTYRYLSYDFGSSSALSSLKLGGPSVSLAWRF